MNKHRYAIRLSNQEAIKLYEKDLKELQKQLAHEIDMNAQGKAKKMDMDDLIDQFIGDLEFNVLIIWADILDVKHGEDMWLDDMWPDAESELRQKVAEAMGNIGKKG